MREQKFNKLGFYRPTFLGMHVHCTSSLIDLNTLVDIDATTYIHEYIHFLQDISTTFGLMNICSVVDYMKAAIEQIRIDGNKEFIVPFEIDEIKYPSVVANIEYNRIVLGSGNPVDNPLIIEVVKEFEQLNTPHGLLNIPRIIIKYSDSEGIKKCAFGGYCVSESMAYLLEKFMYPESLVANRFPYETASIVANSVYPSFSMDQLNLAALCDASLMYSNPGVVFYESLEKMVQSRFIPKNSNEVYQFVHSFTTLNFNNIFDVNQLFIYFGNKATQQLSSYFTSKLFNDSIEWLTYTISNATELRLRLNSFILDIALDGDMRKSRLFNLTYRKIGSPFVVNDNHEFSYYSAFAMEKSVTPDYLWAINQVYKILFSKPEDKGVIEGCYKCEMIGWCIKTCTDKKIDDWTGDRCRNTPWERAEDSDPNFCTLGRLWKTWGLEGKTPVSILENDSIIN